MNVVEKVIRSLFRILVSMRFAVCILITIALLLLVGVLLPDVSSLPSIELWRFKNDRPFIYFLSSTFGMHALKDSYYFLFLCGLLFLSLLACSIERIVLRRKMQAPSFSILLDTPPIGSQYFGLMPKDEAIHVRIMAVLKRKWNACFKNNEGSRGFVIQAERGFSGFYGSVLFHIGITVIIIGAFMSCFFSFSGGFTLTEGFDSNFTRRNLVHINESKFLNPDLPPVPIILNRFELVLKDGIYPIDYICHMAVDGREDVAKINKPIDIKGFTVTPQRYGFAPGFLVKDSMGNSILDAHVNLEVRDGREDRFEVPETDLTIFARFYPDFRPDLNQSAGNAEYTPPKNPVFHIKVFEKDRMLFDGLVPKDKPVAFGKYIIIFNDLRHWVYFRVSKDYGLPLLTAGAIMSVMGLVWRFYFYDRTVWIRATNDVVEFYGWSKYFPMLFKEDVQKIMEAVKNG